MSSSPRANASGTMLARKSTRKMSYAYDSAGRITSASDPDSAYAYAYDSAGRLTSTDNNTTPNLPHVVLTNFYNAASRRFGLTSTVNSTTDFSNTYNYDFIGRMNNLSQSGSGVAQKRVDITYNNSGQYSKITRSSTTGTITEVTHSDYSYDSAKRLTSLVHKKPNNTALVTYGWTYDNQGRVKTFTNPDGTVTFGYDAASQVTSTSGGTLSETYTYDKSGNRTISGYTTGADNRLTSDGTYNYTYDAEGNRTRRTKISDSTYIDYTYDYRNRLTDEVYRTSAGVKTKALHYVYDVNNRRIERQLDATGDGVYESKERYIYDGEDIVLVYDGSNALVNRYLHGPDFDQPLAEESGGVVKWELPDEQGSIRDMGDNAGNLVAGSHVIYNSFGVVTSGTPGRYAYTGREWDSDAGMYYYRARWYDANIGRFISQDPMGFDAGDVNLYRYVGNSSPNAEDPSGMDATQNFYAAQDRYATLMQPGPDGTVYSYLAEKADPEQAPTRIAEPDPPSAFFDHRGDGPLIAYTMPRCMACHGTGVSSGRTTVDQLPENYQMAIMQWTRTDTPQQAQASVNTMRGAAVNTRAAAIVVGSVLTGALLGEMTEAAAIFEASPVIGSIAGGAIGGGVSAFMIDVLSQADSDKPFDFKRTLRNTALGAAFGGVIGGVLGGAKVMGRDTANFLESLGGGGGAFGGLVADGGEVILQALAAAAASAKGAGAAGALSGGFSTLYSNKKGSGSTGNSSSPRSPRLPNPKTWRDQGGQITWHADGTTTYVDWEGNAVTYSKEGYPDFSNYTHPENGTVQIKQTGDNVIDFPAADAKRGMSRPPEWTWHHHEDTSTMQLVPTKINTRFWHTGGASIARGG